MPKCISVPAVIEAIERLPTKRSELMVLNHLLRRRITCGSSIERLYAGLLMEQMTHAGQLSGHAAYLRRQR